MTATELIGRFVIYILNPTVALLFAVAFLVFLWGVTQFIWTDSEEHDREEGRQHMIWGIVGMFIMVAALGIVSVVMNTFGIRRPTSASLGDAPSGYSGTFSPSSGVLQGGYPLGTRTELTRDINFVSGGGANNNTPLLNRALSTPFGWIGSKYDSFVDWLVTPK